MIKNANQKKSAKISKKAETLLTLFKNRGILKM